MKVQEALTEVMRALPAIGKEGRGPADQGGYAFRGIEQITREVQPLLAKFGVIIAPLATLISIEHAPGMKDSWTDVVLSVRWNVIGPEGDAIEAQTVGIGRNGSDKGANVAMSQAFKYLLLDLFCISDAKDDADEQDYSSGHRDEPAFIKTAGMLLFDRLAGQSPEMQAELRALKNAYPSKVTLTVASFDADPQWLDAVVQVLDNASA